MCLCVLKVCTSACDGHWGAVAVWGSGGLASNFSQNAAIVPKIEQRRAATLIFHLRLFIISSVFTYLCLPRKKKSVLKGALSCGEAFFNKALCSNMVELT